MLRIYDLRTEYLTDPVGVDAERPRLSWKLDSDKKGVFQKSYRITAETDGEVIWDSGVNRSEENLRIPYGGKALSSRQRVTWSVRVSAADEAGQIEEAVSGTAFFEMGLLEKEDWKAKWIEPEKEVDPEAKKPAPYLRRDFEVKTGLTKARIYHTAHGLYEFWLNGVCPTEEKFKPGLTSYYHRIQYQITDITDFLTEGKNCWSVMLGDGWWRGTTGGTVKNNFGYKLHYFGQIELDYEDGSREVIGTDERFRYSTGAMLASDMMMGDIYDARLEPEGWKQAGYDDSGWKNVHLAQEHTDVELIPCRGVPVHEKEIFFPTEFTDKNGKRILDFGQNIAGYVRMKLHGTKPGQRVRLLHGEDIRDGCFSQANINQTSIKTDAFQEVTYICKGTEYNGGGFEEYSPLFSIFGFRYVCLEGYEEEIHPEDFTAVAVYSDLPETGDFQCSNRLINQLVKNSRWSQKGNFLDVPVDCPTRERNTWTGDNQIYVRTAADFMDVYAFYEKCMQDQAIEQYASGKVGITFPSTSSVHNPAELEKMKQINPLSALAGPEGNGSIGEDCAGWGDSAVWIPYMLYLCYGDIRILENQYPTAKKWVDYMLACAKEHNPLYEKQPQYHHYNQEGELDADYIYDTRMHYGEWQEPIPKEPPKEGESVSLADVFAQMIREGKPKVATAYMCRSSENVAHMAEILGNREDAEKYQRIAEKIRKAYETYLIAEDGVIEPGHQAAYVRALAMNLCSGQKREKVTARLLQEIEANGYKLNTGFLSTPFLLPVLADCGYPEIAFRILEQTENPGWLHAVVLGATTILESWDGMDVHDASYNHYSYGAVCEFLFGYVAGIRPEFTHPGYKEFHLKPLMGGSLSEAKAVFESQYGTIISEWKRKEEQWKYHCRIPANTRAKITLPDGREMTVGSGEYYFENGIVQNGIR